MNKAKKLIMVLVILTALIAPVLASQSMSVTWRWSHDDQDVNYYRYQVNGEEANSWTVVPSTVLSYDATDLDPYQSYTLYLQCSYDGENWSESATAIAEPLLVANAPESTVVETAPVAEEPADSVAELAEVAEEPTVVEVPVEETAVAEETKEEPVESAEAEAVAPAKTEKNESVYGYKTNLLITGGAATNVAFDGFSLDGAFPRVGVAFDFQNIIHKGIWGLGLRFDVNSIFEPEAQDWSNFKFDDLSVWFDNSVDAKLMMYLGGDILDFYLGGGAGYSIFNPKFSTDAEQELYGHSLGELGSFSTAWFISANAGMRFRVNSVFSLGVEANYRYLLPAKKHTASADLVLGFTF